MPETVSSATESDAVRELVVRHCSLAPDPLTDRLAEALDHHWSARGKQVRGHIALSCGGALGLDHAVAQTLAASVECLHNASLIQDDLQDCTSLRRGLPPVWKAYGVDTAICLTDLLLSAAYGLLADLGPHPRLPDLIRRLHAAASATLRGQLRDTGVTPKETHGSGPEECLRIAVAKSGPFFALALELPLCATGRDGCIPLAQRAAMHFGTGYQVYDDLEDLEQDEREGNLHNLVLAYARAGERDPLDRARSTAVRHLEEAARLSLELPLRCGVLLADEARNIRDRMVALW
ncbi:MAG: polyprenyl synthetase [Verrucomicrobia bacterium]|nr:polyprenyl synthetase [Verrucomicrobiota bacterium]